MAANVVSGSRLSAVSALVFDFKLKFLSKEFSWQDGSIKTWMVPSAPDCCKIELFSDCLWFLHTVLHRNPKYS